MARQIRVEFPGAVYHITARGNEGQVIFRDNTDHKIFLTLLSEMAKQFGVKIHVYCLMPNHYHLVVATPRGNLSQSIGWLQVTYTIRFNRRHNRYGHLFQGRFKAILVDADAYAQTLTLYLHLNPVRPEDKNIAIPADRMKTLNAYPWSSHQAYAETVKGPAWLDMSWLQYWGKDKESARKAYMDSIRRRFNKPAEKIWDNIKNNIVLGGDTLLKRVQEIIKDKKGNEEERWMAKKEHGDITFKIAKALEKEQDKKIQIWARVRLGGERLVDVGKHFGYRDGSGILQTVKRLEEKATQDTVLGERLSKIEKEVLSSVKS
ncbi:MAG: transposase [Candidatus Omnitrophica bacterium]|nr:transposase [Candidatus Omnitrophota bacterium]